MQQPTGNATTGSVAGTTTKAPQRKAISTFIARHVANQAKMSEPRDFDAWKKQHGVPADGKVFAMTGWYPCVKQCLLDRYEPDWMDLPHLKMCLILCL